MRLNVHIIPIVLLCVASYPATAQDPPVPPTVIPCPIDSVAPSSDRTTLFYDSLESRSSRRRFTRFLYKSFFRPADIGTENDGKVVDEVGILEQFNGKTISEIITIRDDVYPDKSTWFRSLVNGMHVRTLPATVNRDLLFRTGDAFDASVAVTSNQIIQGRAYIAESRLSVAPDSADTTKVIVTIHTRDNWTIGVDGEIRREFKEATLYLYDDNFMGTGDRYGLNSNFRYDGVRYGGHIFDLTNTNFFGTFYNASLKVGRNFEDSFFDISMNKEFILPTDYEAGASYSNNKLGRFEVYEPDEKVFAKVQSESIDVWGGMSRYYKTLENSAYATWRYGRTRFMTRPPDTGPTVNPVFHDFDQLLVGVGLYHEKLFLSSMIYGYGFQEYISSGQRFELTGGYSWQEFDNYYYAGMSFSKGGFTTAGHFRGDFTVGSYINVRDGSMWRSAANLSIRWFSNLYTTRRSFMRQFVTVSYTHGWNQGTGAGARIIFDKQTRPVTFDRYVSGLSRLLMNTETVVFTPLEPLGFRIAMFGFLDTGLIGNRSNPFDNEFFGTFGIGIRLKNSRLVFNAIQLRFGFALGKEGFVKNRFFNMSVEQRISRDRFIPQRAQTVEYK